MVLIKNTAKEKVYKYDLERVGVKMETEIKNALKEISKIKKVSINNLIKNKLNEKELQQ